MNSRQHRSITRGVEQIQKQIMKEMESLRTLQKYSSRVDTKSSLNQLNDLKNSCKVMQIKPSSRGHKKYTVSQLHVATSSAIPANKYSQLNQNKSNKENIMKNQSTRAKQNTFKQSQPLKQTQSNNIRSSLKTQYNQDEKMNINHQRSVQYCNPNHYVSQNLAGDNLFGDYELSDSEQSDKLFPEDSLNFQLRQEIPKQSARFGQRKHGSNLTPKKQLIQLLQMANKKSEVKRKVPQRPVQCTFKPVILDKSKQMAEKLGSSYTRLTSKTKNTGRQNTYKQPTSTKTYSKQRLNTLSRPRVVTQQPQPQIDEQYTFKPVLSKKSLNHFNGCYLNVVERSQLWENQRQQKIERIKQSQQQSKNQRLKSQCSAVKLKSSYKPDREVKLSQFGKEGLLGYFERVTQASEIKKRQKEAEVKFSGKGWNGSITKPQQFKLSSTPNQLSYRSKSKNTTTHNTSQNPVERQYEKAIKQLHDKIQKLHL